MIAHIRYLAMYQVAWAALQMCMSRAHKSRTSVSSDMARLGLVGCAATWSFQLPYGRPGLYLSDGQEFTLRRD